MPDRLRSILDNIDQDLFEERTIQLHNRRNFIQFHDDPDITILTDRFHKPFTGGHHRIQFMVTQLRLRNTHDIGEVRYEMAHAITTFDRDA